MKTLLFIVLCCLMPLLMPAGATAQNIRFDYDAAGNCIVKYKTVTLAQRTGGLNKTGNINDSLPDNRILTDNAFGNILTVIAPNPTKGVLLVEFRNKAAELAVKYRLMQTGGQQISEGTAAGNSFTLDLSTLPAGIYMLRLTIENKSEIYKIIKQ